jgi:O-antigen/teichoic acid export membrane protein
LSNIKKLAGQTLWYGGSSIAARFINYLLTPFLTYNLAKVADFGKIGLIYSALPLLNVLFTYGFETAYFRFSSKEENKNSIYSTASLSLIVSTVFFTILIWIYQAEFGSILGLQNFPQIIRISIFIVALDALSTIPFARLRQESRPHKFAFVKIGGIIINIILTWFFISFCPQYQKSHPVSIIDFVYDKNTNPVTYVMLANLFQSIFTLVLLAGEIKAIRFKFNVRLWKEMMIYAAPLLIAGMGGMINETFDRLMLRWWLPGTETFREEQVGIYNACYKLSILITLFIQAFRLGAEPFFFKQAEGDNPQRVYARVMKFFVITVAVMFLAVSLYMPVWRNFISPNYWGGLGVVPILLMANISLGIYYNLSIWYKLSNRTKAGATITLLGAGITFIINALFIPAFGFYASAWATFFCYFSMMVISFVWGQKVYYVPYAWKKLVAYLIIVLALFFIHKGITALWANTIFGLAVAIILTGAYLYFVLQVERKEFERIPVLKRFIKAAPAAP